jgi:hypothetical protein
MCKSNPRTLTKEYFHSNSHPALSKNSGISGKSGKTLGEKDRSCHDRFTDELQADCHTPYGVRNDVIGSTPFSSPSEEGVIRVSGFTASLSQHQTDLRPREDCFGQSNPLNSR